MARRGSIRAVEVNGSTARLSLDLSRPIGYSVDLSASWEGRGPSVDLRPVWPFTGGVDTATIRGPDDGRLTLTWRRPDRPIADDALLASQNGYALAVRAICALDIGGAPPLGDERTARIIEAIREADAARQTIKRDAIARAVGMGNEEGPYKTFRKAVRDAGGWAAMLAAAREVATPF